ncbi:MAG: type II toxin-antitoxin system ParD family antitoxin [Thermoanaerobaculia bacterium]|nr:type II toxin-antitoxin system ParD family antitoxin [Thermoanaerobaculia bacterium]
MMYKGTVKDGAVVLEAGVTLPEGAEVRIGVPPVGDRDVEHLLAEPSLDAALEKFHLLYKIHRGIEQADAGQTVSHEEARERLQKWLA